MEVRCISTYYSCICIYNDSNDLDLKCIAKPRTENNFLCSDGETSSTLEGCYERNAPRIQCKKNYYPCNELINDKEFDCEEDCSSHGGIRDCQMNGE